MARDGKGLEVFSSRVRYRIGPVMLMGGGIMIEMYRQNAASPKGKLSTS